MDKIKVLSAINLLKSSLKTLEYNLYNIKYKNAKHDKYLNNVKSEIARISSIIKDDLYDLQEEFEKDCYNDITVKSVQRMTKINSPSEASKENIKKILNIKNRLVNNAIKKTKNTGENETQK